jgi:hypothetical protein
VDPHYHTPNQNKPLDSQSPKQSQNPSNLSAEHRRQLEEGSAIAPEVLEESGAQTIHRGRELPEVFSERQRRRAPGILFPLYRPNDETSWCFRPDREDPDRPGHKYEQPPKARGGAGNALYVHPSQRHLIADRRVPVIFGEGIKKALAIISAARKAGVEVLVVAVCGVWNWMADGESIPDLADIPLEGRNATIMFDSDMLRNESVQDAAKRFAEYLIGRGAAAFVTYFRDKADGSKVGADDHFAGGGTFAEVLMLTRRYNPADFREVRLSRSEQLSGMLEDLHRTYAAMPAARVGECSDRATMREAIRRAEESGQVTEGGIVVRLPVRPLSVKTRLGRQGQANSLRRLQAHGYTERIDEPPHKVEKQGAAYLLKASTQGRGRAESGHYRRERPQQNFSPEQTEERKPLNYADSYTGVHSARAPRCAAVPELRHSKVVHTWAWRRGRRVVVDSEYVYRLAKTRQEVLMHLLDVGGAASEAELLERFGSKSTRPRDFHRRKIAPLIGWRYTRDKETGAECRLETGPQIVSCEDGMVRILPEWREALEQHRKQTGELEDNRRQEHRYRDQSKAYRNRDRTPAGEEGPLRGKEAVARMVAEREREDAERWVEEQRQKVGETAATFLADEMAGISAVRFKDVRHRWQQRGGRVEDLRPAVLYGPFKFKREDDGDLYVHHADGQDRPAGPTERMFRERMAQQEEEVARPEPERKPPMVEGVYQHDPLCGCMWCEAPLQPSYARMRGAS